MRVHFKLADAIAMADHALACTHVLRTPEEYAAGIPARPAVLFVIDTEVYLISNGSPSQFRPGMPGPFTATAHLGGQDVDEVREAADASRGAWIHRPIPADSAWINVGRQARSRAATACWRSTPPT